MEDDRLEPPLLKNNIIPYGSEKYINYMNTHTRTNTHTHTHLGCLHAPIHTQAHTHNTRAHKHKHTRRWA